MYTRKAVYLKRFSTMVRQLFVYYRIPKADIAMGLACASQLIEALNEQGLGTAELFQREETEKPYFTLMEVIRPTPAQAGDLEQFSITVDQLATFCFAILPTQPVRHTEVFNSVVLGGTK